jgi:hypothetical protein
LKCGEKVEIANITFLHSNEKFYYFQKEIDLIVEEIKYLLAKRQKMAFHQAEFLTTTEKITQLKRSLLLKQ